MVDKLLAQFRFFLDLHGPEADQLIPFPIRQLVIIEVSNPIRIFDLFLPEEFNVQIPLGHELP
jgi:hypothetical protein